MSLGPKPGLVLSGCPPPGHSHPFIKTTSLLPFDVDNISITFAPASNSILLHRIPGLPVFVFFLPLFFVPGGHLEKGRSGQLPIARGICGTMLYCCVPVSNVSEVMYILRGQQSTRCEGMDRGIPPLIAGISVTILIWNGSITYPFHPETSTSVHHVEEVIVLLAPEPV